MPPPPLELGLPAGIEFRMGIRTRERGRELGAGDGAWVGPGEGRKGRVGRRGHGPFGGEGKSWAVCYFEPVYTIKLFIFCFFCIYLRNIYIYKFFAKNNSKC